MKYLHYLVSVAKDNPEKQQWPSAC